MREKEDPRCPAQDTSCVSFKRCKAKRGIPYHCFWLFGWGFWPVTPFRGWSTWVHDSKSHLHIDI